MTLRCNWQSATPRAADPDCSVGWGLGQDCGTWPSGWAGCIPPAIQQQSLPCPLPVSKGQGGRTAMFRLFIQDERRVTNSRTSPLPPRAHHHRRPPSKPTPQGSNVTTKYDCGAHAMPMPNATRRRGWSPTLPGPAQASSSFLRVYLLPTWSFAPWFLQCTPPYQPLRSPAPQVHIRFQTHKALRSVPEIPPTAGAFPPEPKPSNCDTNAGRRCLLVQLVPRAHQSSQDKSSSHLLLLRRLCSAKL